MGSERERAVRALGFLFSLAFVWFYDGSILRLMHHMLICLQCFDAVGRAAGRASGL